MPFKSSSVGSYSPVTIDTIKPEMLDGLNAKFAGDPTTSRKQWRTALRKTLRSRGLEWSVSNKEYTLFVPKNKQSISSENQDDYVMIGTLSHDGKSGKGTVTFSHDKLIAKK